MTKTKADIRKQVLQFRNNITSIKQQNAAQFARNNFIQNIVLTGDEIIAAYMPINSELDCLPLVEKLQKLGHEICLPVVVEKNQAMVFRRWEQGGKLCKDAHNISTPNAKSKSMIPDIIIMPLVAFDKNGTRLGYGKGYYDRTIAKMEKKSLLVGYAFAGQEVEYIEQEAHDVPLDYLVNEKEVRQF